MGRAPLPAGSMGVSVQSIRNVALDLRSCCDAAQDLTPAWEQIGPKLDAAAKGRLSMGGAPSSWPPLKHPHPGRPALVGTGAMRAGIQTRWRKLSLVQRCAPRYSWYQQVGSKNATRITGTAASRLIAAGAQTRGKGKKIEVLTDSGAWASISKQGSYRLMGPLRQKQSRFYVDENGKRQRVIGPLREGQKRRQLRREQAGRGGIESRHFLFLTPALLEMSTAILADHVVLPMREGADGH